MVVSRHWSARREGWTPQTEDARDDGDIDYARVIHSASFRRLQGKTQILNLGDSDFYRTRLTHSLEVAQIAGGIARQLEKSYPGHPATPLLPDRGTIHSIGCTHDFGHPPFTVVGGELLFEMLSQRCERGSTLITSNLPFDEWTSVFVSERLTGALLDRLTHHVHILEMNGDSFRLASSRKFQKVNEEAK